MVFVLVSCDTETPEPEHTHNIGSEWQTSETEHWKVCDGCDELFEKAVHTFDNGTVTKEATHTEKGTKTFTCTVCGYEKTEEIAAKVDEHTFATVYSTDATHHWFASTCGHDVVSGKAEHTFEKTSTVAATCTEDGYHVHTCSVCGYKYNEPIDKLNHSLTRHPAVEVTCTEDGNSEYYSCTNCDKYYSDAEATTEIEKNSWIIPAAGHILIHHESVDATISNLGQIEHWVCSACGTKFSDAMGTTEITDVTIPQLVASISQIKTAEIGDELIVRGIVVGYSGTAASRNLKNMILLKDENSNVTIGLGAAADTALETELGTASANVGSPYPQGTIIEIPVTYVKSTTTYANGQAQVCFLIFTDKEAELSTFVKGTATNFAYDYTAEDIVSIANQSDFFKFMGLANGSNDPKSDGYAYDVNVAAGNAFKLVKFINGVNAIPYKTSTSVYEGQYYRIAVDSTVTSFNKENAQVICRKGENRAARDFSPVFRNNNTFVNTGKTFSELLFGITEVQPTGSYTDPLKFDGVVYAMFVGGNDYYAQFVIIDEAAVIPNVAP